MDVDVGTPAQRLSLSVAGGYSGIALVQEPCVRPPCSRSSFKAD